MNVRSWLVFLSGCETALGYSWSNAYSRRDDYATLAQAFLFSGARNVVATLWRIDDRGAAEFARGFYGALSSSSPSIALASAQRALIRSTRYAAPYYWAGYVLSGSGDGSP
jgi:CHAT domain-containing protein